MGVFAYLSRYIHLLDIHQAPQKNQENLTYTYIREAF